MLFGSLISNLALKFFFGAIWAAKLTKSGQIDQNCVSSVFWVVDSESGAKNIFIHKIWSSQLGRKQKFCLKVRLYVRNHLAALFMQGKMKKLQYITQNQKFQLHLLNESGSAPHFSALFKSGRILGQVSHNFPFFTKQEQL